MAKRFVVILAVAALVSGAFAPSAANASGWWLQYSDRGTGLCMDVSGSSTADGAMVHETTCKNPASSGAANQQFQLQAVSGGSRLVAYHSYKCVGIAGGSTADYGVAEQSTCTGSTSQTWQLILVSTNPNGSANYQFKNLKSGKCLTGDAPGFHLYQLTCDTGNIRQIWRQHLRESDCRTCLAPRRQS